MFRILTIIILTLCFTAGSSYGVLVKTDDANSDGKVDIWIHKIRVSKLSNYSKKEGYEKNDYMFIRIGNVIEN